MLEFYVNHDNVPRVFELEESLLEDERITVEDKLLSVKQYTMNEDIYRKAITSSDIRFFIEKLKAVISKKIFEESAALPFSQNKAEKYAQIRFLTNACVDTMVDYFKGNIDLSLDEVGGVIIDFLNKMKK